MIERPEQEHPELEDEQPRRALDPRAKVLAGLTPQQRYVLYALIAIGVAVVLFMQLSSR